VAPAAVRDRLERALAGRVELVDEEHATLVIRDAQLPEVLEALDAVRGAIGARTGAAPRDGTEPLTDREREVLSMLADGRSNRRIADALGISENTVKAHVGAILAKLGATTRTEAVTIGVRLGLVML